MNKYMAGFIATIVMSLLLMLKSVMGLMPDLDIIAMLASKMGGNQLVAWVAHFIIGSISYGIVMALMGVNRAVTKNFTLIGIGVVKIF